MTPSIDADFDTNDSQFESMTVDYPSTINERLTSLEEDISKAGRDSESYDDADADLDIVDYNENSADPTPFPGDSKGGITDYARKFSKWTHENQTATVYGIFGLAFVVVFAVLYFIKPKGVMKKYKGKKCVDWASFMKWCVLITLVLGGGAMALKMYMMPT
jgi:hypothetical protein